MNDLIAEALECEHCLTFSPFIYARCLRRVVLNKKKAVCELGIRKRRVNRGRDGLSLYDNVVNLLSHNKMTINEIILEIPEYKASSVRKTVLSIPDIKKIKVKKQRALIYYIE